LAAAWIVALAATSSAGTLVTNGNFETPVANPPASQTLAAGSTTLTGWTVDSTPAGGIEFGSNYGGDPNVSGGSQAVELLGGGRPATYGGMNQTITTVVGQAYTISIDTRENGAYGNYSGTFNFGTQSLTLSPSSNASWETFTATFSATSSSTQINLTGFSGSTTTGLCVDNVNVAPYTYSATWVGGAAGHATDWGTASNWSPSGVPNVAGDTVNFGSQAASYATVDLWAANRTVGIINFVNTTGSTIQSASGNYLILDNSGSNASITAAGQQAINAGVQLNSNVAVTVTGASDQLTFNGSVANGTASSGIALSGAGTLVLAASNIFSGPTSVASGTLLLSNGLALQNSTLTPNGGAVAFSSAVPADSFTVGGLSGSGNVALTDNGGNPVALTANSNANPTYAGVLSGNGSLRIVGSGMLTLSNNQTYTGATTVNGGTLQIGGSSALQNSAVGSNGSGVLALPAGTTSAVFGGLSSSGNLTLPSSVTSLSLSPATGGSPTFSGTLSGLPTNVNLTMNGPGSQTLSNVNFGAGSLNMDGGVLTMAGTNIYGGSTNVNLSGGTLNLNGTHSSTNSLLVSTGAVVNVNGMETINGSSNSAQLWVDWQTSAGTAVMNVSGTLNLATASGNSNLVGQEFGTGVLNIMPGGVVNVAYDDLRIGNTSSNAPTGIVTLYPGSLLTLDSTDTSPRGFIFANNGGSGTGSEQATLNLNGGTIMTGRNVNGGGGTATFNFNGGVLMAMFSSTAFVNTGINGASVANIRNGGLIINTNGNSDMIVSPLQHSNIAGDNAVDGGLTLDDTAAVPGTLTLAAANTYTGPTTVIQGALVAGAAGAIPAASNVVVSGGTLDVTAYSQNINSLAVGPPGTVNLNAGNPLTIANGAAFNGGTINLSGVSTVPVTLMTYGGAESGAFSGVFNNGSPLAGSDLTYGNGEVELISMAAGSPFSGSGTWIGTTASWNTAANWIDGNGDSGVPGNGQQGYGVDTAAFSGSSAVTAITLNINPNLAALSFSTSNYTLNGGTLTMYNSSTGTSTMAVAGGRQSIASAVYIAGGGLDISLTGSGSLAISGDISDDNGQEPLTLGGDGSGRLVLSGTNTYGGGTYITAGTLILESATALADGSSLTVGQGASAIFAPAGPALAPATAVPEPGTLVLLGMAGIIAAAAGIQRRNGKKAR
jgi:fibronectin-binding autotransporter adhesin